MTFFCELNKLIALRSKAQVIAAVSSYPSAPTKLVPSILGLGACTTLCTDFCHLTSDACNRAPLYQSLCNEKYRNPTISAVSAQCKF